MEEKPHEEIRENIAFLDVATFDDKKAFRGGILVTDINTYPIEFRVTSPIRPTALQTVLYGNTLESYMYVELITLPLIRAIKSKPLLVLTRSDNLLEARKKIRLPLLGVSNSDGFSIKTHPNFDKELHAAKSILGKMNPDLLMESFSRIQAALGEAHKQKIGEK